MVPISPSESSRNPGIPEISGNSHLEGYPRPFTHFSDMLLLRKKIGFSIQRHQAQRLFVFTHQSSATSATATAV